MRHSTNLCILRLEPIGRRATAYALLSLMAAGCENVSVSPVEETPVAATAKRTAGGDGLRPGESAPSSSPQQLATKNQGRVRLLTFDDLKFDWERGQPFERDMLTPEIEALDGQRVKVSGYMGVSSFYQVYSFGLFRDNLSCCFGPQGAALYDCMQVDMREGRLVDYTPRPVTVTGTFLINDTDYELDGEHFCVFQLIGEIAK